MNRKHDTREAVAYLLATIAGFVLLPTTDLVTVRMNAHNYGNEYTPMSGIQPKRESVIALTVSIYAVVFVAPVGIVTFLTSNGETLLDSLSVGVDVSGSTTGSIPEPTPTPTEILTLLAAEEGTKNTDLGDETQET